MFGLLEVFCWHVYHMFIKVFVSHIFFLAVLWPNAVYGLLILQFFRSHTTTPHSRQDSSGRVIISSPGPLLDNTQYSQQTQVRPPTGFDLKSQQWNDRRSTLLTSRSYVSTEHSLKLYLTTISILIIVNTTKI
jgi:hypothetical protein